MVLSFPRDLVFEAYLGRWVDVTALPVMRSLRQVEPVTVAWGLPNEQADGLAPPSVLEGVLNNEGGIWTPDNPMSDYWAYLRTRNTPTRLALRVSRDAYGRTLPSTWGPTDTGDAWNLAGGTFSVGSGVGVQTVASASSYILAYLGDAYPDCLVAATGTWNVAVAGGDIEPLNLVLRYQTGGTFAGEHYLVRFSFNAARNLSMAIFHSTLGAISPVISIFTYPAGSVSIRAKFQAEGQTLRAKVYAPGPSNDPDQFEPVDWNLSAHHERLTGGFPGIRTGVAAGNTNVPVSVSYDDWELRLAEHSGELAGLRPTWDATHKIKKATVKSAGVSQRLGRPNAPALANQVRRYLAATNPKRWWPLDDPSVGTQFGAPLAGDSLLTITRTGKGQSQLWGQADLGPHIPKSLLVDFANLDNLGIPLYRIQANCPEATASGSYAFDFLFRSSTRVPTNPASSDDVHFTLELNPNTSLIGQQFTVMFNPTAGFSSVFGPSLATVNFDALQLFDGETHHVRFRAAQVGGNVSIEISIDAKFVTAFQYVSLTLTDLASYLFHATQGGLPATERPWALGHVVIWTGGTEPDLTATSFAMLGRPGETALARAIRYCAQEGVSLDYYGDPAETRAMGRERFGLTLLQAVTECAVTDGAFAFEPRYSSGLAFRSRRSMCARPADAVLSYSSGTVVPEFAPAADDRPSANYVTATDAGTGVAYLAEQTTGVMNTRDPWTSGDPDAIGRAPRTLAPNANGTPVLADAAQWVKNLGTVPEVRFPRVLVNHRAAGMTAASQLAVDGLTVGSRLVLQGLSAADVYRDLDQLVRGGRTVFDDRYRHEVALNTAPYERYRSGVYGDAGSRYDGAVSSFDSSLTTTTTGARNVTVTSGQPWTTDPAAYPLDVLCEGERLTISGVTGTGPAQVMTISARGVNGAVKAHPAGARIELFQPVYYC